MLLLITCVEALIGRWEEMNAVSSGEVCFFSPNPVEPPSGGSRISEKAHMGVSASGAWLCTERGCGTIQQKTAHYKAGSYSVDFKEYLNASIGVGCVRRPGVAFLTHEIDNIGHESRDLISLARLVRSNISISAVLSRCTLHPSRNWHIETISHLESTIRALLDAQAVPPVTSTMTLVSQSAAIAYHEAMRRNRTSRCMCFSDVVQKDHHIDNASVLDENFYRAAVYRSCSIVEPFPSHVLVVNRSTSRGWEASTLAWLKRQLAAHFELPIVTYDTAGESFCQQVSAFASATFVVLHQGAEMAGNGLFLSNKAVVLETQSQLWSSSGNENYRKLGLAIVPSTSVFSDTYPQCEGPSVEQFRLHPSFGNYMRRQECKLRLNTTKFLPTLNAAMALHRKLNPNFSHYSTHIDLQ